ncbi:transcriptional regulator [Cupriavidus sp. L7L]|uniref:transcriptional regulator n=1 Tax=Cupriavidus sp. L7L TaxID=2546443 RepID=UPI001055D458|nr:transcriptional regulator [Cupriavidus sp. L7L]TDF66167.1 transcriptional regulator [Cupriavidus sp. L7L]
MQEEKAAYTREELDNYFASFAGMEGGNLSAAVWICDVAPYANGALSAPLQPVRAPGAWDRAFRQRHKRELIRWQKHYKIARIMAAARAATLGQDSERIDGMRYLASRLYAAEGWELKLSLFPMASRPDGEQAWSTVFRSQPELSTRKQFLNLCRLGGRFRFLAELRRNMRPKVLVCLGARQADDYVRAFGFEGVCRNEVILQPADLTRTLQCFWHEGTAMMIAPAFGGAHGLNSDVLLDAMGQHVAQWLVPADFAAFPAEG